MIVRGASLPGGRPPGEDRWAFTESGVIVLDGATTVRADVPPAGDYVDALVDVLTQTIDSPADTRILLVDAIGVVSDKLDLTPGAAPSSTVALFRDRGDAIEVAALGDSTIVVGLTDGTEERLTDDKINQVATPTRDQVHARLRGGSGYDEHHRQLLQSIQAEERAARNTDAGYWIAEADRHAGHHAVARRYPRDVVSWAVLATDGAQRGFDHRCIRWADLPRETPDQLAARLDNLHRWESADDPDGRELPRSKRHDDKTVATWIREPRPEW